MVLAHLTCLFARFLLPPPLGLLPLSSLALNEQGNHDHYGNAEAQIDFARQASLSGALPRVLRDVRALVCVPLGR